LLGVAPPGREFAGKLQGSCRGLQGIAGISGLAILLRPTDPEIPRKYGIFAGGDAVSRYSLSAAWFS
jgi:hypothetical protein